MAHFSKDIAHSSALVFHHQDPTQKEFDISSCARSVNREKLNKELDKCILLCHNCHAELHYKEYDDQRTEFLKKYAQYKESIKKIGT